MKCDYCGYDNKPDVRCCAFCGVELVREEAVRQEYDPEYVEYKKEREKQERRRHWEKIFQAEQRQMASTQRPPVWRKEEYQKNHVPVPGSQDKDSNSLGVRLKRMPRWIKFVLIIMLFSQPVMAVVCFLIWLIYDQSRSK